MRPSPRHPLTPTRTPVAQRALAAAVGMGAVAVISACTAEITQMKAMLTERAT
jgi:hypothetical protein